MNEVLTEHSIVERVENAAVAGVTALTSDTVDMRNCDKVTFIAETGEVLDTCVLGLQAQQGDESDGSDAANFGDPIAFTADATSADNKNLVLDVINTTKRYVRVVLTRITANAVINGIQSVKKSKVRPVTQDATTVAYGIARITD